MGRPFFGCLGETDHILNPDSALPTLEMKQTETEKLDKVIEDEQLTGQQKEVLKRCLALTSSSSLTGLFVVSLDKHISKQYQISVNPLRSRSYLLRLSGLFFCWWSTYPMIAIAIVNHRPSINGESSVCAAFFCFGAS